MPFRLSGSFRDSAEFGWQEGEVGHKVKYVDIDSKLTLTGLFTYLHT